MKNNPFYLKQLEIGPMENFIYLIGDREKKECVMVDPAWDVDAVLRVAAADGMKVIGGLVTHTHFDHCNGVETLLGKMPCKIYVHKNEAQFLKTVGTDLVRVSGGDKISVGDIEITFFHTPGHTPGSQCFIIQNHLVSGDTLFINACGRCDLPGGNATQMFESLQKLAKLGDETVLLPGHNYADHPTSTIGLEKKQNPYYQYHSLADFLSFR